MANAAPLNQALADANLVFVEIADDYVQDLLFTAFAPTDEASVENVKGPNGILGSNRSAGGWSIAISRRKPRDNSLPDYDQLKDDDAVFIVERLEGFYDGNEFVPVRSIRYLGARVSTVNDSVDESGNLTQEVTVMATSREITRLTS